MKDIELRLPIATSEYVDVTFASTANADTVIPHSLNTPNYDDIRYLVVEQDGAGSVYRDLSATRRAWGRNYLILRASTASLTARLLLFTERG